MICDNLKALRGNRSQEETARMIGISLERYKSYEEGSSVPADEIKNRIADAFGKTVKEIFFDDAESEKPGIRWRRDIVEIAHQRRDQMEQEGIKGVMARYDITVGDLMRLQSMLKDGVDPYDVLCMAFDYGFVMGHRATLKGYKEKKNKPEGKKFAKYCQSNNISKKEIASVLKISEKAAEDKMNGEKAYTLAQIKALCIEYGLSADENFM